MLAAARAGAAEQDPQDWWSALRDALDELAATVPPARAADDAGNAQVEFLLVAVVFIIPLVYLVVFLSQVQAAGTSRAVIGPWMRPPTSTISADTAPSTAPSSRFP